MSIIFNREGQCPLRLARADGDDVGLGMPQRVHRRLFHNPVHVRERLHRPVRKRPVQINAPDLQSNPSHLGHKVFQGDRKTALRQIHRAQPLRKLPQIIVSALDGRLDILEPVHKRLFLHVLLEDVVQ